MSLPKITQPIFHTTLPITKKSVSYRPIVVKEEKLILMATQSGEPEEMRNTIAQILTNCVLDVGFDPDNIPIADIEWLLICIREKSIGASQKLEYVCNHETDGKACGHKFKVTVDFSKLQTIKGPSADTTKLQINDDVGIKLRPPSFGVMKKITGNPEEYDYTIIANVVEFVYDKETTYKMSDCSKEEINEFFDSFPKDKLDVLYKYIEDMPRYEIDTEHKCEKCGHEHKIKVSDLSNFFQ